MNIAAKTAITAKIGGDINSIFRIFDVRTNDANIADIDTIIDTTNIGAIGGIDVSIIGANITIIAGNNGNIGAIITNSTSINANIHVNISIIGGINVNIGAILASKMLILV